MITANLYIEKNLYDEPKTFLIWNVLEKDEKWTRNLLGRYLKPESVDKALGYVERQGKVSVRAKRKKDNIIFENWLIVSKDLEGINKVWMEVDDIHNFSTRYMTPIVESDKEGFQ